MGQTYRLVVSLRSGSRVCLQFGHRTVKGFPSLGFGIRGSDFTFDNLSKGAACAPEFVRDRGWLAVCVVEEYDSSLYPGNFLT